MHSKLRRQRIRTRDFRHAGVVQTTHSGTEVAFQNKTIYYQSHYRFTDPDGLILSKNNIIIWDNIINNIFIRGGFSLLIFLRAALKSLLKNHLISKCISLSFDIFQEEKIFPVGLCSLSLISLLYFVSPSSILFFHKSDSFYIKYLTISWNMVLRLVNHKPYVHTLCM